MPPLTINPVDRYPPIAAKAPWARFVTRIRPIVTTSPIAISARTNP